MTLPRQHVGDNVWDLAVERTAEAMKGIDRAVVMFSGGKDSTSLLWVVDEAARTTGFQSVEIVFMDEEAIPPETIEYVQRVARKFSRYKFHWLAVPFKHRNACSKLQPWWYCWNPQKRDLWVRKMPEESELSPNVVLVRSDNRINYLPTTQVNGYLKSARAEKIGVFIGLRSQESLRRYRAVTQREALNYVSEDEFGCLRVKPIYDWMTPDVWTLVNTQQCDYNRSYDVMTKAGVSAKDQRICPPYGEEPLRFLHIYSVCWPEMWERMLARVDGAAAAGRYGGSPLYGLAGTVGFDPEDPRGSIETAVKRWRDLETRKKVIARIREEVNYHYNDTQDPIPVTGAHPESGVSWEWLYMIAQRGDLKARRDRTMNQTRHQPKATTDA